MLTVQYAKNPIWNDAEHSTVLLTVKFEEFAEELPFTATPYDDEQYGVDLYNNAIAGEYGPISPYVPPPPPPEPIPTTNI